MCAWEVVLNQTLAASSSLGFYYSKLEMSAFIGTETSLAALGLVKSLLFR